MGNQREIRQTSPLHQRSSPYLEEYLSSRRMPAILSEDLAGYKWELNTIGQSGGAVYRLHDKQGVPDLFLKYGKGLLADDVTDVAGTISISR